jgi:adenosylcobinamide kinase / adenosylcobinamide-phosphate guanylyltransferase
VTAGPDPHRAEHDRNLRAPTAGGRTLVLGGVRSGKSAYAESLLPPSAPVRYVATGYQPGADADWSERVRKHQERRSPAWQTIETIDVAPVLADAASPILIDCFSIWLARLMDKHGCWLNEKVPADLTAEIDLTVEAWRACRAMTVAVSSEVGLGVLPGTWAGRSFGDLLGGLNQRLAAASDHVWLLVAGLPARLK